MNKVVSCNFPVKDAYKYKAEGIFNCFAVNSLLFRLGCGTPFGLLKVLQLEPWPPWPSLKTTTWYWVCA